jgi:hypothetical protein
VERGSLATNLSLLMLLFCPGERVFSGSPPAIRY